MVESSSSRVKKFIDFFQALNGIEDFENRLALFDFQSQVRRHQIGQYAGIADVVGDHDDLRRQIFEIQNLLDFFLGRAHQGFDLDGHFGQGRLDDFADFDFEERTLAQISVDFSLGQDLGREFSLGRRRV